MSLFTNHHSLITNHHSQFTIHNSQFTNHHSQFTNHHSLITICLLLLTSLVSCIKDEPQNNECDILSAWVEGEEYTSLFFQPSQMRIDNISSDNNKIDFIVISDESLPLIAVNFTITPGATIYPESGSLQDFSNGPVTYTVTSEDGHWTREYQVCFREKIIVDYKFSYENVEVVQDKGCSYDVFFETDTGSGERQYIWATANAGVALVNNDWTPEMFPSHSINDGYIGKGVCLSTQNAGPWAAEIHKPIATGNLFIGSFNTDYVLTNTLQSTQFGMPVDKVPIKVTGWYKYSPGQVFTDENMNVIPGRVDKPHIYGVFYRNQDENGNSFTLDGTNHYTSQYIVSFAEVESLPPTDVWTPFEMTFEDRNTVNPTILSSMGYSFTIVFSSSFDGDTFLGAVGSTLLIDEINVEFEE